MESVYDPRAVEELIEQQDDLEQRLDELEQQITTSTETVIDQAAEKDQDQAGQAETSETSNEAVANEGVIKEQQLQQPKTLQDSWQALRNRGGYTIQLIGVTNKESIPAFTAKHGLRGELAYITTERDGKAWHILLLGMYDSYTEATKALQDLPDSLKPQQPWARKMPSQGTISGL
jgi:septal ring-binding cell division protein DamX